MVALFMVMELVEGQPLYRLLRQADALNDRARLRIIRAVAGAVAHAHQHGILHRDCKPANIMVRKDGEPILIDWGLAATGDPRAICGTPSYAAPEQLSGQVADRRSDIYALGVLSYEVLSGALPFARVVDDFDEFRRLRAGLGLIPLRKVRPDLAPSFQALIDRAMAAQPAGRFARCEDFCVALDDLSSAKGMSRTRGIRWLSVVMVLVALGVGFFTGFVSNSPDIDNDIQASISASNSTNSPNATSGPNWTASSTPADGEIQYQKKRSSRSTILSKSLLKRSLTRQK